MVQWTYRGDFMKDSDPLSGLRLLSAQDFLSVGMQDVAYVRRIVIDSEVAYCVHAADGTPISVEGSVQEAVRALRDHNLEPVQIH